MKEKKSFLEQEIGSDLHFFTSLKPDQVFCHVVKQVHLACMHAIFQKDRVHQFWPFDLQEDAEILSLQNGFRKPLIYERSK